MTTSNMGLNLIDRIAGEYKQHGQWVPFEVAVKSNVLGRFIGDGEDAAGQYHVTGTGHPDTLFFLKSYENGNTWLYHLTNKQLEFPFTPLEFTYEGTFQSVRTATAGEARVQAYAEGVRIPFIGIAETSPAKASEEP